MDEFSKRLNGQVEELKADLHGKGAVPEGQLWDEYSNRLEEITGIKAPPPSECQQAAAQSLADEKVKATQRENAAIAAENQILIDAQNQRQADALAEQEKLDDKFKADEAAKANKVTDTTDTPDPTANVEGKLPDRADENGDENSDENGDENTDNDSDETDDSQDGEETDTDEDSGNNESKLSDEDKDFLNHLNDISGGGLDSFSSEDQQAALVAYKSALEKSLSNRNKKESNSVFEHAENRLSQAIRSGDSARLNNVTSTIDNPENESEEGVEFNEDENQELSSLRGQIDVKESGTHPLDELPKRAQLDIAQALVKISQNEQNNIDNDGKGVTDNQRERIESGTQAQRKQLIAGIRSGNLASINNQVKLHRGDDNESPTERATNQGGARGPDGGGAREPVVSATSGTTGQSGTSEGASEEVANQNVDGEPAGGPVPNKVISEETEEEKTERLAAETAAEEARLNAEKDKASGGGDPPKDNGVQGRFEGFNGDDKNDPPPPPTNEDAPEKESEVRIYRRESLKGLGDKIAGLEDVDHHNYRDTDSIVNTLLEFPETEAGNLKFSNKLKEAREAHREKEETETRTSTESNKALADSIRSKEGMHEAILEDIANHVDIHNGREINDVQYKDLDSYIEYFHSLPEDERRKEMERNYKTAQANAKTKETEEAKAAEEEETEATKQKAEEDKAAWATESRRVQEQMSGMPTILGAKGKILDQWDNSAALHYFRNLNSIVWHDTRVNLKKAGVDTSDIKDLSGLLSSLGKGDRMPSDIYSKITNSASAINAVLTPRQKRDLGEEMETVNDYMSERHRRQIATDNETSRKNEEDYQERLLGIVDKGMSHPIFSSTADDNYREYPPKRMKRFNTIYEAGKIIPLYSDPKDMKKKDEAEALRRETDNVGEETPVEQAKRRTSQGHPPTESPGEGYAYHPETGQWMDRERFDSVTAHFDEHLKLGETASFAPTNTLHTEHIGRDKDGKRSVVLKSHEPLSRRSEGASDYVSVTKNRDGKLIWSPVRPPEQNKHGFISPDDVVHDTGDSKLDERLNNAHAIGQVKGTVHALDHEEGSSGDHVRHGTENNIVRHHSLGGKDAPKNVLTMGAGGALNLENFSNVAGNILNFSRKHGGSLAKKLKLNEATQKAKDITGLRTPEDVASLFYNPTAQPKLYRRLLFGASKKEEAMGEPAAGLAGATARGAKKVEEKVAPIVSDVAERASRDVKGVAERVKQTTERAAERAADVKESVEGKVQQGGIYAGEKVNQVTSAIAEQTGSVVDTTTKKVREGASQVGQDIASTGMAGAGGDQPPSAAPPPETSKNKLTEDPAQTRKLREGQAKLKAIRERQNSGVGEASRTEDHGTAVDAFHNFTVEDRAERDGITGTDAPDLTPVKPNRAQRRAAEGKGAKKRVGIPSQTESTTTTTTPTAAPQPRPRGGYEALT